MKKSKSKEIINELKNYDGIMATYLFLERFGNDAMVEAYNDGIITFEAEGKDEKVVLINE